MAFPTYTKTFHNSSYPAINPSNPALSTAGKVVVITGGGSGIGVSSLLPFHFHPEAEFQYSLPSEHPNPNPNPHPHPSTPPPKASHSIISMFTTKPTIQYTKNQLTFIPPQPRIAHAFALSGSTQIALVGRTASSLLQTASSITSTYPSVKVLTFVADIVDRPALSHALTTTVSTFNKPIDILISNAAYMPNPAPIGTGAIDEWFSGMEVNVKGNLNLLQEFLLHSKGSNEPTFVHVTTGGAHAPPLPAGMSGYGISKLAATRVMDYFMFENPQVRVMNVHPGVLDTEMNRKAMDAGFVLPFDDSELASSLLSLGLPF
jgi:NAD(P)-dependent dehydrogenase (short-subunit alcohol dehydrogenase family)